MEMVGYSFKVQLPGCEQSQITVWYGEMPLDTMDVIYHCINRLVTSTKDELQVLQKTEVVTLASYPEWR